MRVRRFENFCLSRLKTGSLFFFIFVMQGCQPTPHEKLPAIEELFSLIPLHDGNFGFSNRYLILVFVSPTNCTTCNDALIDLLDEWKRTYGKSLEFALVVTQTKKREAFQLRRVGRVKSSIFITGEESHFLRRPSSIFIVDLSQNQFVSCTAFQSYADLKRLEVKVRNQIKKLSEVGKGHVALDKGLTLLWCAVELPIRPS